MLPNSTRAIEDKLEGTTFEDKITILTLFIIDYNDVTNQLDWTKVSHTNIISSHSDPISAPSIRDIEVKTTIGKKHVYVGANMTSQQIASFYSNQGKFTSGGTTYADVMSDFVDPNRGITMFGQMFVEPSPNVFDPVIEITALHTEASPIATRLKLSRVVSKVAFTYTNSIPASDPDPDPNAPLTIIGGSIKIRNVHFMLNNTSKSIDFISGANIYDYTYSRYSMADYLVYNNHLTNPNPQLYSYRRDPIANFVIYTPESFVLKDGGGVYNTETVRLPIPGDDLYYDGVLEKYRDINPVTQKHEHYASFLYCLENTVNTNGVANKLDMRHGINTKVVVAAKYTPGTVEHTDDPDNTAPTTRQITLATAEDDFDAITLNDPNGRGTFYAVMGSDNEYTFYTYNALQYHIGLPIASQPDFIKHNDYLTYKKGYGYYATFIDQPAAADIDKDTEYNLKRNHYYILNVTAFSPPGVVYPQDAYMLVNSETTDWLTGEPTTVVVE